MSGDTVQLLLDELEGWVEERRTTYTEEERADNGLVADAKENSGLWTDLNKFGVEDSDKGQVRVTSGGEACFTKGELDGLRSSPWRLVGIETSHIVIEREGGA